MAALQFGPRKNSGFFSTSSPSFKTNIESEDLLHYSHAFQTFFLDTTFWQNKKNTILLMKLMIENISVWVYAQVWYIMLAVKATRSVWV